jgi:hypothetical protein
VHIGRPWAPLSWFDLIITTPQYRLPARPNILHNTMPLNRLRVSDNGADEADAKLREAVEALPAPRIAVLVGGNSTSHVFTVEAARRLGEEVSALANHEGGSLLVTTSPRTPQAAVTELRLAIKAPVWFQEFGRDRAPRAYDTFLALADAFVVTGDSASMLAEACSRRKPVRIFPLPHRYEQLPGGRPLVELVRTLRNGRVTYRGTPKQQDVLARMYDRLVEYGLVTPPRDLAAYHEALEVRGLATRLGRHGDAISPTGPDDLQRAVERVQDLFRAERPVSS